MRTQITLNNGVQMPILGFGTWDATGADGRRAVIWTLEADASGRLGNP